MQRDRILKQVETLCSVKRSRFPPVIVSGPSAANNRFVVDAFLTQSGVLLKSSVVNANVFLCHEMTTRPDVAKPLALTIATCKSSSHLEITPAHVGANDRYAIQQLVMTCAGGGSGRGSGCATAGEAKRALNIIVVYDVDQLTTDGQRALRRRMDTESCRFILVVTHTCAVQASIKSRCVHLSVPGTDMSAPVAAAAAARATSTLPARPTLTASEQSFLLGLDRFVSVHGAPTARLTSVAIERFRSSLCEAVAALLPPAMVIQRTLDLCSSATNECQAQCLRAASDCDSRLALSLYGPYKRGAGMAPNPYQFANRVTIHLISFLLTTLCHMRVVTPRRKRKPVISKHALSAKRATKRAKV